MVDGDRIMLGGDTWFQVMKTMFESMRSDIRDIGHKVDSIDSRLERVEENLRHVPTKEEMFIAVDNMVAERLAEHKMSCKDSRPKFSIVPRGISVETKERLVKALIYVLVAIGAAIGGGMAFDTFIN